MTFANREQLDHWNNSDDVGHWVTQQARYDGMLAPFIGLILDGASLAASDRVLDVGCGCGATTLASARVATRGRATGVDLSVAMLERARADAERAGITNATFEQADVQVHDFGVGGFDAVISRFGVMFFADPVAAFANLHRATRKGGRLSFVCWQPLAANQWIVVSRTALAEHVPAPDLGAPGSVGMFAFAEPEHVHRILDDAGWHDIAVASHHPSILVGGPGTLDDAVDFVRNGSMGRNMLAGADAATTARALAGVRQALEPFAGGEGVRLETGVWLVTAEA